MRGVVHLRGGLHLFYHRLYTKFQVFNMAKSSWKTISSAFAKVQSRMGTTRSELVFVGVVLVGLFAGLGAKLLSGREALQTRNGELSHVIDSLAAAEATTFSGSTPDAEPVPALAAADTIVRKKTFGGGSGFAKKEKITSGTININTASMQDLMRLPGVGESTAEKILEERARQPFKRLEDVMRVKGIGKKKFEAIKPFLRL